MAIPYLIDATGWLLAFVSSLSQIGDMAINWRLGCGCIQPVAARTEDIT